MSALILFMGSVETAFLYSAQHQMGWLKDWCWNHLKVCLLTSLMADAGCHLLPFHVAWFQAAVVSLTNFSLWPTAILFSCPKCPVCPSSYSLSSPPAPLDGLRWGQPGLSVPCPGITGDT